MTDNKVEVVQIDMTLGRLGWKGRIQIAAIIGQFAPQSALYTGHPPLKQATDNLVSAGVDLDVKSKAKLAAKQAYLAAIGAEVASLATYDTCAGVFKAQAQTFCKTAQDAQNLGCNRRGQRQQVPLTNLLDITAKPGKELGSILVHCLRIPGLSKYIGEISPNPISATSWVALPGTTARRKLLGYVSGQQYWLRFCTERGTERSDWSEPVPVIAR